MRRKELCPKLGKMSFYGNDGIILGHKVSAAGIEVDRAKIEVMTGLPAPKNVKDVRSFLGHAGFYRRFIQDFSKIARPLNNLVQGSNVRLYPRIHESFRGLKEIPYNCPRRSSPQLESPFRDHV